MDDARRGRLAPVVALAPGAASTDAERLFSHKARQGAVFQPGQKLNKVLKGLLYQ
jgi:hypothetical protein